MTASSEYNVEREIYTEEKLRAQFGLKNENLGACEKFKRVFSRHKSKLSPLDILCVLFPFLSTLRTYDIKHDLFGDIVSGITVCIMQIPQGMAYAMLAELDPVYGLYMSFFPALVYFIFGTSRHISVGTFAVTSLMIASTIDNELAAVLSERGLSTNATDIVSAEFSELTADHRNLTEAKLHIVTSVTLLSGLIQLVFGLLRFGVVSAYLSDPLVKGFTTGCAIHVFTSQLKFVFGIKLEKFSGMFKLYYTYRDLLIKMAEQPRWLGTDDSRGIRGLEVLISVFALIVLIFVKEWVNPRVKRRFKIPVPIELIIVMIATCASYLGQFQKHKIAETIESVPTGLPPPVLPSIALWPRVFSDAVVIAIVSYVVAISMARLLGARNGYDVDSNQELVAFGLKNMICSCFSCYTSSASLSRSLVQEMAGGRTQLVNLISCGGVLLVILFAGKLFEPLPNVMLIMVLRCILASIVLVALKGMILQFTELPRLWRVSKLDLMPWLTTFAAVVVLDVSYGLMVGVAWALLCLVFRVQFAQSSKIAALGDEFSTTDIYRDTKHWKFLESSEIVQVLQFNAPLCYVNCEELRSALHRKIAAPSVLKNFIVDDVVSMELSLEQQKSSDSDLQLNEQNCADVEQKDASAENLEICISNSDTSAASLRYIIVDLSASSFIDYTGLQTINQVVNEYKAVDVTLMLASCSEQILEKLEISGVMKIIGAENIFATCHDAIRYVELFGCRTRSLSVGSNASIGYSSMLHEQGDNKALNTENSRPTHEMQLSDTQASQPEQIRVVKPKRNSKHNERPLKTFFNMPYDNAAFYDVDDENKSEVSNTIPTDNDQENTTTNSHQQLKLKVSSSWHGVRDIPHISKKIRFCPDAETITTQL